MKLQILVPQYKETFEIIKPLLDSIAIQQRITFDEVGVIIANDGSDVLLDADLLNNYPFEVDYLLCEHRGVSATRNACLERATADYVMFCDADDSFFTNNAIYTIFDNVDFYQNDSPDGLIATFYEELKVNEHYVYLPHIDDRIFVHGKIYKRAYLIDNSITFNENLTIHEDSYFNILARTLSEKFAPISQAIYLWRWRDDSVCRHDPDYMLKTYNNLLDSNAALVDKLCELKKLKEAISTVTGMIFDSYFQLNKDEWLSDTSEEYRNAVEKRFAEYYLTYLPIFDLADEPLRNQIIMGVKNRMYGEGLYLEKITFADWIKRIESIGKNEDV